MNVVDKSNAKSDSPIYAYLGAPKSWLVDSSATDHMLPYGSDFQNYVKYIESHPDNSVVLGDGTTWLPILGKGTIKRWVETTPHTY